MTNASTAEESGELELTDEESLPWLESDEIEDGASGLSKSHMMVLLLILLLALGLLGGSLWWVSNRAGSGNAVADGSTIAAPEGDYKERPEEAGGKQFAGTGNVAPGVGQGEASDGVLANSQTDNGASAGADANSDEASSAAAAARDTAATPASAKVVAKHSALSKGVGVQVGAYRSEQAAKAGWNELNRQTRILGGFNYRVVEGQADIGRVFRLQAVAADAASAQQLCDALKADGLLCQVKR